MGENFPASEKLKSKKTIGTVFSEGKSATNFPVKLIYVPLVNSKDEKFKVGVSVPKRSFKKAVDRNLLKRLMRESYRKNKYLFENNIAQPYAFMIIYLGKEVITYHQMFSAMERLMQKFVEKNKNFQNEKSNT